MDWKFGSQMLWEPFLPIESRRNSGAFLRESVVLIEFCRIFRGEARVQPLQKQQEKITLTTYLDMAHKVLEIPVSLRLDERGFV